MRWFTPVTLVSVVGLSFGFTAGLILLPDQPGIEVSQSQYATHWPFEVEQARLRCEGKGAVILNVRGMDYALNGLAASNRYRPIQAVMIDPKIDIGPIISRGLTLCKWGGPRIAASGLAAR
jgi:Protein of unknown function (DUF2511)